MHQKALEIDQTIWKTELARSKKSRNDTGRRGERTKILKNEETLQQLFDFIMKGNFRITGIPEEDREKGAESLFKEIIAENFPDVGRGERRGTRQG